MKLAALIKVSLEVRKSYITRNALQAYRLFTREETGLPLAVDIYGDNAVIHLFDFVSPHELKELETALIEYLHVQNFFYKNRANKHFSAYPINAAKPQPTFFRNRAKAELIIKEDGHKFLINLSDYQDTGLFLDHRETRKWIGSLSKGKIVLNSFAYTGSFSIYAAAGGAEKTYSVDLSKTYCEWIKKNLALNNLPLEKNWVYKMDTFEFFKYARKKKLSFNIIIIDPPTFSRNKGKSFSVQLDHPRLINEALALLKPDGFILFSNNFQEFSMNRAALSPCRIEEKTNELPADFQGSFAHWCFVVRK